MQDKKRLNREIGSRIQLARENIGMTQERLAERIERSTQFVSTIERGVAGPSLETIVNLCEVLSVSADWLLLGKSPIRAASVAAKLGGLTEEQLIQVDRMTDCLLHLIDSE